MHTARDQRCCSGHAARALGQRRCRKRSVSANAQCKRKSSADAGASRHAPPSTRPMTTWTAPPTSRSARAQERDLVQGAAMPVIDGIRARYVGCALMSAPTQGGAQRRSSTTRDGAQRRSSTTQGEARRTRAGLDRHLDRPASTACRVPRTRTVFMPADRLFPVQRHRQDQGQRADLFLFGGFGWRDATAAAEEAKDKSALCRTCRTGTCFRLMLKTVNPGPPHSRKSGVGRR